MKDFAIIHQLIDYNETPLLSFETKYYYLNDNNEWERLLFVCDCTDYGDKLELKVNKRTYNNKLKDKIKLRICFQDDRNLSYTKPSTNKTKEIFSEVIEFDLTVKKSISKMQPESLWVESILFYVDNRKEITNKTL